MNKVLITPNSKTNSLVNAYQSNPEYGYLQLSQTSIAFDGQFIRESKRSTLIRGKVSLLEAFVKMHKGLVVPGHLVVKEFVESAVPVEYATRFLNNENLTDEENKAPLFKRAGKDGPELTVGGERILRFTLWDESGTDTDVKVLHDNGAEVRTTISRKDASLEA